MLVNCTKNDIRSRKNMLYCTKDEEEGECMHVKSLSIASSLFIAPPVHLKQFEQLLKRYESIITTVPQLHTDQLQTAFNLWCLFYEDEQQLLMDYSKSMAYSSSFYCLDLLRAHQGIQSFLDLYKKAPTSRFFCALCLASEIVNWTRTLLTTTPVGQQLLAREQATPYYERYETVTSPADPFYEEQKWLITMFVENIRATDDFARHIDQALQRARDLLKMVE